MNFPHIIYGGDYNPDQWTPEIWQEDARLMQEAGVNLVSLGIFSWTKMEPRPGVFDFAWLDQLMDLLHAHGVSVNLATPTASPPAWMVRLHPELLPVTGDGITLWHGSRRHYCPHNRDYRQYATRIATQLAERYQDHPALAMWHLDAEYAVVTSANVCDNSCHRFPHVAQENIPLDAQLRLGHGILGQIYTDWERFTHRNVHPLIPIRLNNSTGLASLRPRGWSASRSRSPH
jgi:beta-galactosidase